MLRQTGLIRSPWRGSSTDWCSELGLGRAVAEQALGSREGPRRGESASRAGVPRDALVGCAAFGSTSCWKRSAASVLWRSDEGGHRLQNVIGPSSLRETAVRGVSVLGASDAVSVPLPLRHLFHLRDGDPDLRGAPSTVICHVLLGRFDRLHLLRRVSRSTRYGEGLSPDSTFWSPVFYGATSTQQGPARLPSTLSRWEARTLSMPLVVRSWMAEFHAWMA